MNEEQEDDEEDGGEDAEEKDEVNDLEKKSIQNSKIDESSKVGS